MVALSNKDIPLRSSLLDNEPELLELIKKYVKQYPLMISEIKDAFEEGQWEKFEQRLHNLKSTGGNYGFMSITQQAIEIKKQFNKKNYAAVTTLLNELADWHQRMLLALY